jgi:hypothetical protein
MNIIIAGTAKTAEHIYIPPPRMNFSAIRVDNMNTRDIISAGRVYKDTYNVISSAGQVYRQQ